jgi:hypothetical protein
MNNETEKNNQVNNISFVVLLLLIVFVYFITNPILSPSTVEKTSITFPVDSVVFKPQFSDNVAQPRPYWKYRLKGMDFFLTSLKEVKKGDTINVLISK